MDSADASWYFQATSNTSAPAGVLYPRVPSYNSTVNFSTYHFAEPFLSGDLRRETLLAPPPTMGVNFGSTVLLEVMSDMYLNLDLCRYAEDRDSVSFSASTVDAVTPSCEDRCRLGGVGDTTTGASLYCLYHYTYGTYPTCSAGLEYPTIWGNDFSIMLLYMGQIKEGFFLADIPRGGAYPVAFGYDITEFPVPGIGRSEQPLITLYSAKSGYFNTEGHNCFFDTGFLSRELAKSYAIDNRTVARSSLMIFQNDRPTEIVLSESENGYFWDSTTGIATAYVFDGGNQTLIVPRYNSTGIQGTPCATERPLGCADAGTLSGIPYSYLLTSEPECAGETVSISLYGRTTTGQVCTVNDADLGTQQYVRADWSVSVSVTSDGTEIQRAIASVSSLLSNTSTYGVSASPTITFCDMFGNVSTNCADEYAYTYSSFGLCLKSGPEITEPGTIGLGSCSSEAVIAVTLDEPQTTALPGIESYQYWDFGSLLVGYQICAGTQRVGTFTDPCSGGLTSSIMTQTQAVKIGSLVRLIDTNNVMHTGYLVGYDDTKQVARMRVGNNMTSISVMAAGLEGYYPLPSLVSGLISPTSTFESAVCTDYYGAVSECVIYSGNPLLIKSNLGLGTVQTSLGNFTMYDDGNLATFRLGDEDPVTVPMAAPCMLGGLDNGALSTIGQLLGDLVSTTNLIAFGVYVGLEDVATALAGIQSEYLLGLAQETANADEQLAQIYENSADIANLKVLVQYIQLILVTQLGVNASTIVTPAGQPLIGKLENCTAGLPGQVGNTTAATCYLTNGTGQYYDVGYTTDCVPMGLPYTGAIPIGSDSHGGCLYDPSNLASNLFNLELGNQLAANAAQYVNASINAVLIAANQFYKAEMMNFNTLAGLMNQLFSEINTLKQQAGQAESNHYATSAGLGDLGGLFSGLMGIGNLVHLIIEIVIILVIVILGVLFLSAIRKVWVKVNKLSLDTAVLKDYVTRDEFNELKTSLRERLETKF